MNDTTAGVQLQGLRKSYGPVHAVDGVDLVIQPGETVALLGPNGAGKSTTIDITLGLIRPDAGQVRVFGRSSAEAVAEGRVGAMLQQGQLPQMLSVRELLVMVGSLYESPMPVDEVLRMAAITDIANRRTEKLSGGQAQRVRFAIALVADPSLLVLDEPTVAMDVEGRHAFWASMHEYAATGRTVVFATHYLEEAEDFADRIVLMARGRIVADGPTTQIKSMVGRKVIRATLPGAEPAVLRRLAGVDDVEMRGNAVVLTCIDSDAAVKQLVAQHPDASDIEITGAGLEAAFLQLTGDAADEPDPPGDHTHQPETTDEISTGAVR